MDLVHASSLSVPCILSSPVSAPSSHQLHLRPYSFCFGRTVGLERNVHRLGDRGASTVGVRGLHCRADLLVLAEIAPATAAVYGASLLGGGLLAYTRTGSKGSLSGGITGGVALGVAFYLMQAPETQYVGNAIGFGAALLFASVFGVRLAATGKLIPSGLLLGVSALAAVIFANAYFQNGFA